MPKSFDKEKGLVIAEGLNEAFIGLMMRFNVHEPIACYDYDRVIQGLIAQGATEEEAIEYFDYNILGSWVGDRTPYYLRRMSLDEAAEIASDV